VTRTTPRKDTRLKGFFAKIFCSLVLRKKEKCF
jgi:hypothetical protein